MRRTRLVVCTIVAAAAMMMIAVHESRAQCCGYASLPLGLTCIEAFAAGTTAIISDSLPMPVYEVPVSSGTLVRTITNTYSVPRCSTECAIVALNIQGTNAALGTVVIRLDAAHTASSTISPMQAGTSYAAEEHVYAHAQMIATNRPGRMYQSLTQLHFRAGTFDAFCPFCPVVTYVLDGPVQFADAAYPDRVALTILQLEVTTI